MRLSTLWFVFALCFSIAVAVADISLPAETTILEVINTVVVVSTRGNGVNHMASCPCCTTYPVTTRTYTVSNGVTLSSTGSVSTSTIPQPPSTATGPLPFPAVTSSASVIAIRFHDAIPIIASWALDSEPPLQTKAIDSVKRVKHDIEDLAEKSGHTMPKCGWQKRGLFDGLLNLAGNTIWQILDKLSCIDTKLDDLVKRIKDNDVKGVQNIVEALDLEKPPNPGKDNKSSTSSSSSSTSSSSSCTSKSTVHHVTVLCKPTSTITRGSTVSTTTCSPTTTITITGCSVTETTTTVTSTPGSTHLCSPQDCGNACRAGKGGWVFVSSVNCASIPTSTVSALPTGNGGIIHGRRGLVGQATGPKEFNLTFTLDKRSLPELSEVNPFSWLLFVNHAITYNDLWASQLKPVTGKWYPWPEVYSALGVKGLHGCTVLMITTKDGVYLSHMFESPIFRSGDEPTVPDDYFMDQTFNALRTGRTALDGVNDQVEPMQGLWGTDEHPGPLHRTNNPQLIIITPFVESRQPQEYVYPQRVSWLAAQFTHFLYFPSSGAPEDKAPIIRGYERTDFWESNNDDSDSGKAILEVEKYNRYLQIGTRFLPIGQWRLWLCGKHVMDYEFWDTGAVFGGQEHIHRRDRCAGHTVPPTMVTSKSTTTTSTSTTKSTTKSTKPTDPPTTKPSIGDQTCLSNPKPHQPFNTHAIDQLAALCDRGKISPYDQEMGPDSEPIKWSAGSPSNSQYYVTISWVKGCNGPKQMPIAPIKDQAVGYSCQNTIKNNFNKCLDNDAYGGSRVLGCLEYRAWVEN